MNVQQTVNISTNIHNERIKTNMSLRTFLKRKENYLKSFKKIRCSNINGAMHQLLVGECLTGAKSVR